MMLRCLFAGCLLLATLHSAASQNDCPSGWLAYNNKCWYFSHLQPTLTWYAAESWCQQNNGHLASFATVDERDWVVQQNLEQWDEPRWWIGLNDVESENNFVWSDGSTYDSSVSNWKPLEPNNAYLENCVEIWIEDRINDQQWNDRTCEGLNSYVCKRDPGTFSSCPSDYQEMGGRCYFLSGGAYQWLEAQDQCKLQGANLVSIGSSSEQSNIQSMISSENTNFWIGFSDTSTPGTMKWVDGTASSYNNWAGSQPGTTLPYKGSTCAEMDQSLGYAWSTERCSSELRFVCERGFKADCPPGWLYSSDSGKCYEFVVNPSRVETWTNANKICSALGGGMLKIESQAEETFVGGVLQGYSNNGHPLIYLGGSDIGHDDSMLWWDQSPIQTYFWSSHMPDFVQGRDDCLVIYTGKSNYNWETATCFTERAYICEIPEGQSLAPAPIVTVEGRCDDGWRHFEKNCYFFGSAENSQSSAESYCVGQGAHLTSILKADEMSFIVGHLQRDSWIGLQIQGSSRSWIDNQPYQFENWSPAEPNGDGDCAYASYSGEWYDSSCSAMKPFICKKAEIPTDSATLAPPTYVPDLEKCGGDNWISDPSSNRCYKVNLDPRSWVDARYACQIGGGDLASPNSPEENDHIQSLISGIPTYTDYWLGGSDLNGYNIELLENGWEWADGSPFNYIHWNDGEPNNADGEDCMEMFRSGFWNDMDCYKYFPSVCEKVGNVDNIIGTIPEDENCQSNQACCFAHLGAEYGGALPDSAMSASTERDQWFVASRGRLNTPADVIIIDAENDVSFGTGHGAWSPTFEDPNKWLQVDLADFSEVKGIITQGRNGVIQYTERSWVTSYKVSFSQDANAGKWEFISDPDGNPIEFKGNSDQNTQVTNLFPRPIIARHLRCHPLTWYDAPCMRLEYIGCKSYCLNKLGMNSGLIPDGMITSSSARSGREAKQARAPVDKSECLPNASDKGTDYRGWIAKTTSGLTCQEWSSQTPHRHDFSPEKYPSADLRSNYCRNPNGRDTPWCYTTDSNVEWENCYVPVCPNYVPSGWSPSSSTAGQFVQVQFSSFYKVSGVTLYKASSSYVTSYFIAFSDDGSSFRTYQDQNGKNYAFTGLSNAVTQYTDIIREPVSTKYVRIMPQQWSGDILLQFELHGCYVNQRISCSDLGTVWGVNSTSFTLDCPAGCTEDFTYDIVYGTDTYTLHSAVCPAAIHAGKVLNSQGGSVNVKVTQGLNKYTGSFQNGITSDDYGPYPSSFVFSGDTLRCDDGWIAWQNHCYYLSMKGVLKTWQSARTDCLSRGADLASISSNGENSFVETIIYQADQGGDVWIGFNDIETENYYQWSDGSPVTITKWFVDEPKYGKHRCVNMYRFEAYWNDKDCEETLPYLCKKKKELLPPLPPDEIVPDEGCDVGWKAYGSSCYQASSEVYIFIYAQHICEESGAQLATINDEYEQAFVFSLVTNTLPPGLGYTSWIGLSAKTEEAGTLYYEWESGEPVTYTHWDKDEPDVRFSCAFPFVYKGVTYYECTTYDHPAKLQDTPWCSIDPVYRGRWINCDTGYEYGCTFMDDSTGFWQIDICGENRYWVCEKDRVGYTTPSVTTPSTEGSCASGWYGDSDTTACYQINAKAEQYERLSWFDALDFCRAQRADLVSVHSYEEEQKIIDFVYMYPVYTSTYFWMGLTAEGSGYQWTDGTAVSYTNWAFGEPNNQNGNENCVENSFYYSGTWNDISCQTARNWICKIDKGKTPLPSPAPPSPGGQVSTACGTDETWILFQPTPGVDKCYLFMDDYTHGWSYAQRNCSARGGNLVSIHSEEESTFILSRTVGTSANVMWIGLRDLGSSEGRSFQWADNSSLDYQNWANGEPNNYLEQEDCTELQTDTGLWNDDNCGIQNPFICEKYLGAPPNVIQPTPAVPGGCPPGFMPYGNKCYMFGTDHLSWYDMIERCNNNSAEPATIQNPYEQAFVVGQLGWIGQNVWIGLSGRTSMEYVWHDQSDLTYTNWDDFEPNGYYGTDTCVEMTSTSSKAGRWADQYCYDVKAYSCYVLKSTDYPDTTPAPDVCAPGYYAYRDACYKVMDVAMTQTQAQEACTAEGDDVYLTSVRTVYENNLIRSWFWRDITAGTSIWTGLSFKTTAADENIDPTTTFKWDDGWIVDYTNWATGEPDVDALSSGSGCAVINSDGTWTALPTESCQSKSMPFICKQSLSTPPTTPDPGEGSCDPGYFAYGTNCYLFQATQASADYRSWHEAVYECETRGATLASFHSDHECEAIVTAIGGNSQNLFIGLSSDGYSGWKWVDGTGVDYFNWVTPGEPNGQGNGEDCVEMYPWNGEWNDVDCFNKRAYICKKAKAFVSCSDVVPSDRYECGFPGIEESVCLRRSCCWDAEYGNENISSCYYPQGIGPSGVPITSKPPSSSGRLGAGAVIGIVAGVLIALVLIAVGVYMFYFRGSNKALSLPSLPTWNTAEKEQPKQSGFDNPVVTMRDGMNLESES